MRTTTGTKNKIKQFEGLRLEAYVCAAGVCTIGYGHTTGVKPGRCYHRGPGRRFL